MTARLVRWRLSFFIPKKARQVPRFLFAPTLIATP